MFMCLKRVNIKNYMWQHVEGISKTDLPVVVPVMLDHDSIFVVVFFVFFLCVCLITTMILSYTKRSCTLFIHSHTAGYAL